LQPQKGEVRIDDLPLSRIDIQSWRRMIGYAPREKHCRPRDMKILMSTITMTGALSDTWYDTNLNLSNFDHEGHEGGFLIY